MDITSSNSGDIIQLGDGGGRGYPLGRARAVFKADGAETNDSYSVSEWWLDPGFAGFGAHRHDANDDMFYVLAGEVTFVLDGQTSVAGAGSFLRVPPGVEHDYRNDGSAAARIVNVFIPGGFEIEMPKIVEWFAAQSVS